MGAMRKADFVRLTYLDLSENNFRTPECYKRLTNLIPGLRKLETIDLRGNRMSPECKRNFGSALLQQGEKNSHHHRPSVHHRLEHFYCDDFCWVGEFIAMIMHCSVSS
jgi:hypothetical protein